MKPRAWPLLALGLALAACARLSTAERNDVRRWLLCEECTEGELERVRKLGDRAVPMLADALDGPPAEGRANMRQQTAAIHRGVDSSARSQARYVGHYESNYIANYQMRAAQALSTIGSESAHHALVTALTSNRAYRPDVRRYVGTAASVTVSVTGDRQHAAVDSVLRVDPVVLVRDAVVPRVLGNVRVSFRVDSGGGRVSDSVLFTDAAGRAKVRWRLGDSATTNVLRIVAGGRIVRLRAFGHLPGPRLVFVVQPPNGRVGQALSPPPKLAVQDAFGVTQTGFNQRVFVVLLGLLNRPDTLVGGEVTLFNFQVPVVGSGIRLRAATAGADSVESDPFDIGP